MKKAFQPALVSTKWLQDVVKTKAKNHRILDASWHLPSANRNADDEYKQQHIPGALRFDVDDCADKSTNLPHMLPSPDIFEKYVGDLGINNDTHVIVYDNNPRFPIFSAQRVWWTFRIFGHDKVSILEGGIQKWMAEKGPLTSDVEKVAKEKFNAKFRPNLVKNYDDVMANLKDSGFQLVDGRPEGRFMGTAPEPRADVKPGCIPNAVNFPFISALDVEKQTMKTPDELKKIFDAKDIDLTKPLVVTCGSGMTACMIALAAFQCGNDQVAVYDGSWTEWFFKAPDELKKNVPSD